MLKHQFKYTCVVMVVLVVIANRFIRIIFAQAARCLNPALQHIEIRISQFAYRISKGAMGNVCAKRHADARALNEVYFCPTEKGWENAGLFKMGHTVNRSVWWGTWRWSDWVA